MVFHLNRRLFRCDSIAFAMQMESCVQDGKTVAVITGTELVLTDDHAEETMQSVLKALKETFNATIR